MIFSVLCLLVRCLPGSLIVLARRQASKDGELLVLQHENTVLRGQISRVRYQPGGRLWLTAVSGLIPRRRWGEVFAVTPATVLTWHRRLVTRPMGLPEPAASGTTVHGSRDRQARDRHGHGQPGLGPMVRGSAWDAACGRPPWWRSSSRAVW